jgi:hypothetical protein
MPNGDFQLEVEQRKVLVEVLVPLFVNRSQLRDWVTRNVHTLVDDILVNPTITAQVTDLIRWAEAEGELGKVLQSLSDDPPDTGKAGLPVFLEIFTQGRVKAKANGGAMPVLPHESWLAATRPFVNRDTLRQVLSTFDAADLGADSVLIIEGDRRSGKTHSVRLARICAPANRLKAVNIKDWGEGLVNVGELAEALAGSSIVPAFDPTKEDAEGPRLLKWLVGKLQSLLPTIWVVVDHCNSLTMTRPARELLIGIASTIEAGNLSNVRLILIGFDRATLPDSLSWASRHDKAELPRAKEVRKWCESLASHEQKKFCQADIDSFLTEVFAGHPDPSNATMNPEVEPRLFSVYRKIMALEKDDGR